MLASLAPNQSIRDCGQIRKNLRIRRQFFAFLRDLSIAGQNQQRHRANGSSGLQIFQGVADGWHIGQIDAIALHDFIEKAGARLAASALIRLRMRTEKNRINAPACMINRFVHFVVDGIVSCHVEQAAPDARLIGRNHDAITGVRQSGDGVQTAGDGDPFVRRFDESIAALIDDAGLVEDDELHIKTRVWRDQRFDSSSDAIPSITQDGCCVIFHRRR